MIVRPQGITSLRPFFCFEGKVGEIFRIIMMGEKNKKEGQKQT